MKKHAFFCFLLLGTRLAYGIGVPDALVLSAEDRSTLTQYVQAIPDHYEGTSVPETLIQRAEELRRQSPGEALKCLEVAGHLGVPEAQIKVARYYQGWDGIEPDAKKAALWFAVLGLNRDDGLEVENDLRYQAADELGHLYESEVFGKNYTEALTFYVLADTFKRRTGKPGSVRALYNAGRMQELLAKCSQNPRDKERATAYYREAYNVCERDAIARGLGLDSDVAFTMARKLELGYGIPRDATEAEAYYEKAADAGSADAIARNFMIQRLSEEENLEELEDPLDQRLQAADEYLLYKTPRCGHLQDYENPQRSFFSGLSIDGGGIRGYIPALLLEELEKHTNRRIYELFDYIGGTSVGGIISLGCTIPNPQDPEQRPHEAQKLAQLFSEQGEKIFKKGNRLTRWARGIFKRKHDPRGLEAVLEDYFKDKCLSDARRPVLVTSFESAQKKPYVFRSVDAERSASHNYRVISVGRATSAAPSYFPVCTCKNIAGHEGEFIDGGVYLNNPARLVWKGLEEYYTRIFEGPAESPRPENTYLLSLGTGDLGQPHERFRPQRDGAIHVIRPVIETLMWCQSHEVDNMMEASLRNHYWRLQPRLEEPLELDDTSHFDTLEALVEPLKENIHQYGDILLRRER